MGRTKTRRRVFQDKGRGGRGRRRASNGFSVRVCTVAKTVTTTREIEMKIAPPRMNRKRWVALGAGVTSAAVGVLFPDQVGQAGQVLIQILTGIFGG